MIPVKQRGDDCWAACVASILEMPLELVPPYRADIDWAPKWQAFLMARNLYSISVPFNRIWQGVPMGWSVLICRATMDNTSRTLDWQTHCLVCQNGRPVWDPSGYRLAGDWDGLIRERDWQVVEPLGWTIFATLDPSIPAGPPVPSYWQYELVAAEAAELLRKLRARTRPYRTGIDSLRFHWEGTRAVFAYIDAATDEDGERDAVTVLREIREQCMSAMEQHPTPSGGGQATAAAGLDSPASDEDPCDVSKWSG